MYCYRHVKQPAVSQCQCGNFLCDRCRSIFSQSVCVNCNYDVICSQIEEVNASLRLVKMSLYIAPLYILPALASIASYLVNYSLFISNILPITLFMAITWAIFRQRIWDAQKKQRQGDTVEIYFYSIFSLVIKVVITAWFGWTVVPFDIIMGAKKIFSLNNAKRQLFAEQRLAFSEINS